MIRSLRITMRSAGLADLERVELVGAQSGDGGGDTHALVGGGIRGPLERTGLARNIQSGKRQCDDQQMPQQFLTTAGKMFPSTLIARPYIFQTKVGIALN